MWSSFAENRRPRRGYGVQEHVIGNPGTGVIDSDVDLHDPSQVAETQQRQWDLLAAISAGGVLGAEARYGLDELLPHSGTQFPWSTLVVNVSGCLLIGVLMVLLLELTSPHRLARPFLGVGVLGGYTTFSSFAVDAERLLHHQRPLLALAYVVSTLALCLLAVLISTLATQIITRAVLDSAVRRREQEQSQ